jgi:aryl-alcohol dehydrogenase-like predicted oxidoreductase
MRYRTLGPTGTVVSTLCLGTMNFGKETDEPTAHRQLDRFVAAGGTFIDTANVYQRGVSEEMIGRWLAGRDDRDDLVIATKARMPMADGPNDVGLSRQHLMRAVEDSLRRLQTDHIDLYQMHCWDALTPLEETLATLDDLVRAGKVRYVGASNFTGWQLQRATLLARYNAWTPIVTYQPQYNLLAREIEWELVPLCLEEGIGLLPWSPLGGGWLTGKYRPDERPTGDTRLGDDPERGVEAYDLRNTDRTWQILEVLGKIVDSRGLTMAQGAVAWVTQQPGVTSTILGARTVEQLDDNLGAADVVLSDEEMQRLDKASHPGLPYPYGFIESMSRHLPA